MTTSNRKSKKASKLIICDLYGTLLKADFPDHLVRPSFQEFWEYYSPQSIFAISTDGTEVVVKENLDLSNLTDKFQLVFDQRHMDFYGGEPLKDLATICSTIGIPKQKAVFIGDNYMGRDQMAAVEAGITFIRIPQYRENPPKVDEINLHKGWVRYENPKNLFSFKHLIGKI